MTGVQTCALPISGSPWTIDFAGAYAGLDVGQISSPTEAELYAPPGVNPQRLATTPFNGAGFEICVIASQCQGGGSGHDAGHVNGESLAVGPTGDVFLANAYISRVEQFTSDGAFKRAWGWGVDTGADQFEICTEASFCEAAVPPGDVGTAGQFISRQPSEIAVDANGIVYAKNETLNVIRLERFDSTQALAPDLLLPNPIGTATPPPGFPAGPLPSKPPAGLEVDPGTGHLYYLTVQIGRAHV